MWRASRLVLVMLMASCARGYGSDVVADVAARGINKVDVRLVNQTGVDVLLISPTRPNRQLDQERCSVLLSTRVQEWVRPYDFTPDLVQISAGEVRTFSVELREDVPANCREWKVQLEYAYVPAKEGHEARKGRSSDFRGYVLENQRIAQTRV